MPRNQNHGLKSVDIIYAEADSSTAGELIAEISKSDYLISRTVSVEGSHRFVVAVLSAGFVNSAELIALERTLREKGAVILPVLLDGVDWDGIKFEYPVSFLPLSMGISAISKHILRILDIGADKLTAWNRLRSVAVQWDRADNGSSYFYTRSDTLLARKLLKQSVSETSRDAARLITDLCVISEKRWKRRIRIWLAAASVFLFFIAIAAVFMLYEKSIADSEAAMADDEADRYESARLSDIALEMLNENPDLPWVLTAKAINVSANSDSIAAARTVLNNAVPHVSYDLRSPASSVVTLDSGIIAVGFSNGKGFAALNAKDGTVVYESGAGFEGSVFISKNPSSTRIAVHSGGSGKVTVFETAGSSFKPVCEAAATVDGVQEWINDGSLLALSEGKLVVIDAASGSCEPLALPEADNAGGVTSAAADIESSWLAVTVSEGVRFYELTFSDGIFGVGDKFKEVSLPDVTYIVYDKPSKKLLVETRGYTFYVIDTEGITDVESDISPQSVEYFGGTRVGGSVAFDLNGNICFGDITGRISVAIEDAGVNIPAFSAVKAHGGRVTGIDMFPDGSWVSAGEDGILRIWKRPPLNSKLGAGLNYSSILYGNVWPGVEEGKRCTLGAVPNSNKAVALLADGSYYSIIDRTSLEAEQSFWLWANMTRAKVSDENGKIIAMRGRSTGIDESITDLISVTDADVGSQAEIDGATVTVEEDISIVVDLSLYGLSPDGTEAVSVVAVREGRGLATLWTLGDGKKKTHMFDTDANIVFAAALGGGSAVAVNALGSVMYMDGSSEELFEDLNVISAAALLPGGKFIAVDSKGNITRQLSGGGSETVTELPEAVGAYAIEVSPSGELAAVICKNATHIVNLAEGRKVTSLYPLSVIDDGFPVHDVLFDADGRGAVVIRSNGWVSRVSFLSDAEVIAEINSNVPRELLSDEIIALDE